MPIQEENRKTNIYLGFFICAIAAAFYCYEFILRIIPGVLQSELSGAFGHIDASTFGSLAALYYFAYSPMQLPVGMLMDRFGPKKLLTIACLACTFGSFLFMQIPNLLLAGVGRFLVGFGSSFAFVGALALTSHWLPRKYFSLVVGLITTLSMLSLIYGGIKLTQLTQHIGLSKVLSLMVVIGLILTTVIALFIKDNPNSIKHTSSQTLKSFFKEVMLVLTSGEVWLIGIVGACLYTSMSVFGELWGKIYLEQVHHLNKVEAAECISFLFLGWAIGAPLTGYLSDHTGRRVLPLAIGAGFSLICISVILYYPMLSFTALSILLLLYGIFSGTEIITFVMAKESSKANLVGTVFASTNMIITLGGVVFQPLVGHLLDAFGDSTIVEGERLYTRADYQIALSILPLSLLLVMILAFFLKDLKRS